MNHTDSSDQHSHPLSRGVVCSFEVFFFSADRPFETGYAVVSEIPSIKKSLTDPGIGRVFVRPRV